MKDYKETINLPHTDFPMKANLAQREPQQLAKWDQMDLYQKLQKHTAGRPKFILHDGPPYANGSIHIGHSVNKILKDIIIKSKVLSGFHAPYVPGWDCHGLPIELNVEKKKGKAGVKIDADKFRLACREYANKQVTAQKEDFIRLGVLGDWEQPYLTMNYQFEADIVRALGGIIQNGHVVKGEKPVHWCADCGSALAEAEVEYENRLSPAIDVAFKALDSIALAKHLGVELEADGDIEVVIWTTTPWTLPANQGIALHPHLSYQLVEVAIGAQRRYLILAQALTEQALARYEGEQVRVITQFEGQVLENVLFQHPFYPRQVPIVLGEHVTTEAGTGAVHTAPAHGLDDFIVGTKYRLPVDNPVDAQGRFLPTTELFAGEFVFKANASIVEVLESRDRLLAHRELSHSYPHCWRHKTPILFRATPQWFISMEEAGLRQQSLTAIEAVKWAPDWGQARIEGMVSGRPDWCISRQRTWGVPIPLFVHKETGELHPRTPQLIEQIATLIEENGIQAWFDLPVESILSTEAGEYEKITDTLDVWFDSGVTHTCVLRARSELGFPADLYLEGSDQHRGWFQSSLLTSLALYGCAPYKQVLTHGFTVDADGKKMSKSLGNVVAPQKVVNQLGADVLRLWVSATDYRGEMSVSEEILKRSSDAYRRIRNTLRFLLGNLDGFSVDKHRLVWEEMVEIDQWVVARTHQLQEQIKRHYEAYEFHQIYQVVHHFCSVELGSFYLDILKDRLYTMPKQSVGRRSGQTAMMHVAEALVRWIAPILSFTAEEAWAYLPGDREESVLMETWYSDWPEGLIKTGVNWEIWQVRSRLRDQVNKAIEQQRDAGKIKASLAADVTLYCSERLRGQLQPVAEELRFLLITAETQMDSLENKSDSALPTNDADLWVQISASQCPKCVRCWHHRPEVGKHQNHPELCGRCIENIEREGEQRRFF